MDSSTSSTYRRRCAHVFLERSVDMQSTYAATDRVHILTAGGGMQWGLYTQLAGLSQRHTTADNLLLTTSNHFSLPTLLARSTRFLPDMPWNQSLLSQHGALHFRTRTWTMSHDHQLRLPTVSLMMGRIPASVSQLVSLHLMKMNCPPDTKHSLTQNMSQMCVNHTANGLHKR